jgi:hypothetical protein
LVLYLCWFAFYLSKLLHTVKVGTILRDRNYLREGTSARTISRDRPQPNPSSTTDDDGAFSHFRRRNFDACSFRHHFSSPCLNFNRKGELVPILPVFVSTGDTLLLPSILNDNSRAKVTASIGCQSDDFWRVSASKLQDRYGARAARSRKIVLYCIVSYMELMSRQRATCLGIPTYHSTILLSYQFVMSACFIHISLDSDPNRTSRELPHRRGLF